MPACDAQVSANRPRQTRPVGGDYSPSAPYPAQPIERDAEFSAPVHPTIGKWPTRCRHLVFPGLWLFIGLVSAFDTYLTIKFQEYLPHHEVNPLARMILRFANWDPSLLISLKFLGSLLALGFVGALHLRNRRMGLTVTAALAAFQLGLLWYLVGV